MKARDAFAALLGRRRTGRGGCRHLLPLMALGFALSLTTSASAATVEAHPYLGSLTPPVTATPKGPFTPTGVAVNQSTGNLYVVDGENDVIDIFKPNGNFFGLLDGSSTPAGSFNFTGGNNSIAIDNSDGPHEGTIYLKPSRFEVVALAPNGAYLASTSGPGQFLNYGQAGLDVDTLGTLRLNGEENPAFHDYRREILSVPDLNKSPTEKITVDRATLVDLAFDSNNDAYAVASQLVRVEPSGSIRWEGGTSGSANAVDVDRSTDSVYALEGVGSGDYVSRYDTEGQLQESFGLSIISDGALALAVAESSGKVFVSDKTKGAIEVFGPRANSAAPDVNMGAVTELEAEAATATGDLSLLGTGTGDVETVLLNSPGVYENAGRISNLTIDTGAFSPGESISGDGIEPGSYIKKVEGNSLIIKGANETGVAKEGNGVHLLSGSKVVTSFAPTKGTFEVGEVVGGPGIQKGTVVSAVDGGTLTLSRGVTAAATGSSISAVDNTATLNGTINPQGTSSSWRFQYRAVKTKLWTSLPLHEGGSGSSDEAVSEEIQKLAQNTTFEVRLQGADRATGAIASSNVATFTTPGLPQAIVTIDPPSSLTPTSAHLAGTVDPNGSDAEWHFEYTTDDSFEENWKPLGEDQTVASGAGPTPVSADLTGLEPNTHYFVRLVATNETGGPKQSEEREFTTPQAPPAIYTLAAGCLSPTSACLAGNVDAENSATTYYFEYGTDESYGTSVPASQNGDAGSGFGPVKVGEKLAGLQPGTTYHFRLVASNGGGTTYGPDTPFKTRPDAAQIASMEAAWPARGNELVNSADKGNQAVYPSVREEPWRSIAPAGDHVMWKTFNGGPGSSGGASSYYIAEYTPGGWVSRNLLPPASQLPEEGDATFALESFSPDFTNSALLSFRGSAFFARFRTHLISVNADQQVTRLADFPGGGDTGAIVDAIHAAGQGRVVLGGSSQAYLGPYPLTLFQADGSAEPVPVPNCGYRQIPPVEGRTTWVNSDASRIFVYSAGEGDCSEPRAIFMVEPESGAITRVSGAQSASAEFLRASPSGNELVFSKGGDLYRWSQTGGDECLTCGSGYTVGQATPSPDLSHVYFCGPRPAGSPAGADCAIYVWRERGIDFVGETSEVQVAGNGPTRIETSEDGSQMIFKTTRPFVATADETGWDGVPASTAGTQLYHYDDDTGILECVSCTDPPSGGLPSVDFLTDNPPAISADGQTIAFVTRANIVPQDINGRLDVYEWHDGLIRLVTDGESEFESSLSGKPRVWGFSPDGRSLFFSVGGVRVTGNEFDSVSNLYDGRVGSPGFPPQAPPAHCVEDSCQGPLTPPPPQSDSASSVFTGPGNASGMVKKKHRHRHRHKQGKPGGHHKRRAHNNRGGGK